MNTSQKASLEAVIEAWIQANYVDIDVYWPDDFSEVVVDHISSMISLMQASVAKKDE